MTVENRAITEKKEETGDTSKLIFEARFQCRVRSIDLVSEDEMRNWGSYTTLDRDIDHALMDDRTMVAWPIERMAEHHAKGLPISIVRYKDTEIIYDYVTRHLEAWKRILHTGINIGDAPIDDLMKLDRFASSIYDHAKFLMMEHGGISDFERFLNDFYGGGLNVLGDYNPIVEESVVPFDPTKPEEIPERDDSMASLLKKHLLNSNLKRG